VKLLYYIDEEFIEHKSQMFIFYFLHLLCEDFIQNLGNRYFEPEVCSPVLYILQSILYLPVYVPALKVWRDYIIIIIIIIIGYLCMKTIVQ